LANADVREVASSFFMGILQCPLPSLNDWTGLIAHAIRRAVEEVVDQFVDGDVTAAFGTGMVRPA
jgi:hypothetical protein